MKCGATIIKKITKKGKERAHYQMSAAFCAKHKETSELRKIECNNPEYKIIETCDGDIIATIRVIDEPTWGGSYAVLEVEYKCKKCGNVDFDELPRGGESLSILMTDYIAQITEEQRHQSLTKIA